MMKNSRDGKSYSTNLAFTPPEYLRTGMYLQEVKFLSFWHLFINNTFGFFIGPAGQLNLCYHLDTNIQMLHVMFACCDL